MVVNKYNVRAIRKYLDDCILYSKWKQFRAGFETLASQPDLLKAVIEHKPQVKGGRKHQQSGGRDCHKSKSLLHVLCDCCGGSSAVPLDLLKQVVETCPHLLRVGGPTPLSIALERQASLSVIRCLLEHDDGHDSQRQQSATHMLNERGDTPLLYIVKQQIVNEQMVKLLVEHDIQLSSLLVGSRKHVRVPLFYVASQQLAYINTSDDVPEELDFMLRQTHLALGIASGEHSRKIHGLPIKQDNRDYEKSITSEFETLHSTEKQDGGCRKVNLGNECFERNSDPQPDSSWPGISRHTGYAICSAVGIILGLGLGVSLSVALGDAFLGMLLGWALGKAVATGLVNQSTWSPLPPSDSTTMLGHGKALCLDMVSDNVDMNLPSSAAAAGTKEISSDAKPHPLLPLLHAAVACAHLLGEKLASKLLSFLISKILVSEEEDTLLPLEDSTTDKNGDTLLHHVCRATHEFALAVPTFSLSLSNRTEGSAAFLDFLVQQLPQALLRHNKQGFLPLHTALIHKKPWELLNLLIQAAPQSLLCPTQQGQVALHVALANGTNLEILSKLFERAPDVAGVCMDATERLYAFQLAAIPECKRSKGCLLNPECDSEAQQLLLPSHSSRRDREDAACSSSSFTCPSSSYSSSSPHEFVAVSKKPSARDLEALTFVFDLLRASPQVLLNFSTPQIKAKDTLFEFHACFLSFGARSRIVVD